MEKPSSSSSSSFSPSSSKPKSSNHGNPSNAADFAFLNEDLLQNILARLPAVAFASAACVSKSWSSICHRILSCPKISSALSLNPSLDDAVNEVVHKVLSEPIRPYFAIVNVGGGFPLEKIMQLVRKTLGSNIPIIVTMANDIIRMDAFTDEFREVLGALFSGFEGEAYARNVNEGIVLTVGYLPGLKVEAIPSMLLEEYMASIPTSIGIKFLSASWWTDPATGSITETLTYQPMDPGVHPFFPIVIEDDEPAPYDKDVEMDPNSVPAMASSPEYLGLRI